MPVCTGAVAEAVPRSEDQPTADREQDTQEVDASSLSENPTEQVEYDQDSVQDKESAV